MKKTLLTLTVTFLAFIANTQTKIYDFPFDNSYSASVGTGTFTSNSWTSFTTDRHGNANGAIKIDSTGTTATLTDLPYGSSARTISLWVNLNSIRADYNFLYNYGTAIASEGAYIEPSNVINFQPAHSFALANNISVWYHFVFTYNGTDSKIYRDGVLISTSTVSKNTVNNLDVFTLGLTENGATDYFDGAIDDLEIYDYALSDIEIGNLFTAEIKNQDETKKSIAVYPNPTQNSVTIKSIGELNYKLLFSNGVVLKSGKLDATMQLNLEEYSSGVYFLQIENGQTSKFIKE